MSPSSSQLLKSVLLCLIFLLTQPTAHAKRSLDRVVVIVNDDIILESDIKKFKRKMKSKSFQELFGGLNTKVLNSRQAIIQLLVEEKLINQQVKKLDLAATSEEIDGQIRAILGRNGITRAQLNQRLRQLGTSLTEYREGIKRQIERRNLIDREIKPNLKISDEQLRHYYNRKQGGGGSLQYKIAHILIENKKGAKKRVNTIWKEISSKKISFEKAAKQYSDDSGTSDSGGLLGVLSAAALAKEFRRVVPKTKVGSFSRPIKTRAGYHIVKVLDKQSGGFKSIPTENKEELRNTMFAEELEKRMVLWLERKKKEAHIKVVSN